MLKLPGSKPTVYSAPPERSHEKHWERSGPVKTSSTDFCKNYGISSMDQQRAEKKGKIGACPRFPEAISSLPSWCSSLHTQNRPCQPWGTPFFTISTWAGHHLGYSFYYQTCSILYYSNTIQVQVQTEIIHTMPVNSTMLTASLEFLFVLKDSTLSLTQPSAISYRYIFHST